jgi:hypothetical protein
MKKTLDLADDVLRAAEALARKESRPVGQVISDLARQALAAGTGEAADDYARAVAALPRLPKREGPTVTLEIVNGLRDREG